uniref:Uncharacterized protein n=1 Tax=Anopheles culicifacies TaxID=139723 RepID=A0A182MSQ8_9DIPT
MKSLSLDSPESSELHGQIRRRLPGPTGHGGHGGSGGHLEHSTPPSNNSRLHSPSSPSGTQRKFLYATRGMKTGSVDLPDEIEKSLSSASTSPCPSPVRQNQVKLSYLRVAGSAIKKAFHIFLGNSELTGTKQKKNRSILASLGLSSFCYDSGYIFQFLGCTFGYFGGDFFFLWLTR